jgi:pyruvate,water dikinase
MSAVTCTSHTSTLNGYTAGLKAESLHMIHSLGLEVPPWIVISVKEFNDHVPHHILEQSPSEIYSYISTLTIDPTLINKVSHWIRSNDFSHELFAVRSSICLNSSLSHTFAGQLKTHLFVPEIEISEAIRSVWASPFTSSANAYRAQWGLPLESIGVAVIIQKMVNPDISGISMSVDPQTGSRSSVAITATYGIYQAAGNSRFDSDQYTVDFSGQGPSRVSKIFEKKTKVVYNEATGSGTRRTPVPFNKRSQPSLTSDQVFALAEITRTIGTRCGKPQIIDWVISHNKVYILQSRPIPALKNIPDTTDNKLSWISFAVSFLGNELHTPFSYSLIRAHTTDALFSLCKKFAITRSSRITRETCDALGIINGKLHLNHDMVKKIASVLPFHSRKRTKNKKSREFIRLVYAYCTFLLNFHFWTQNKGTPSKKAACKAFVTDQRHISTYKTTDFLQHFEIIQGELSELWQQMVKNENFIEITNQLLTSVSPVSASESSGTTQQILYSLSRKKPVKQIEVLCDIARSISDRPTIQELFLDHTANDICKHLCLSSAPPDTAEVALLYIRKKLLKYIDLFGNTGFGTLQYGYNKEHVFHSIVSILRSYIITGLTNSCKLYSNTVQPHSQTLEQFPSSPLRKTYSLFLLKKLHTLIDINHDLNIRKASYFKSFSVLLDALGKKLYSEDIISNAEDIAFLTYNEIIDFLQGRSITENCASLISIRKKEYDANRKNHLLPMSNSCSIQYHSNTTKAMMEKSSRALLLIKGIGNGAGSICGNVYIADNSFLTDDVTNSILVIRDSSPEWIPYIPLLKGLIIEQGVALSELVLACTTFNIPCLISVAGSIQNLYKNDTVELDSTSGTVTRFHDHSHLA